MTETARQLIARLRDEVESGRLWLEIRSFDDGVHLVSGGVECHDDSVAFDDDSGFRNVLAYRLIEAVRSGRQDVADDATDHRIEPSAPHVMPADRWRIAS